MIELFFESLYSEGSIRLLPRVIDEIEDGTYGSITSIASLAFNQREFFNYGMHVSVQCHEEYPFTTTDEYEASIGAFPELIEYFLASAFWGANALELCVLWPAGAGGAIENQPVTSDIPTLVLAGQYDPITPPSWGEAAAETLTNSSFHELPAIGHGATFEHDCARSMVRDFLQDPATEPDSSCVTDIDPIDFAH